MSVPSPLAPVGRGAPPPRSSDPPFPRSSGAVDSSDQSGFGAVLGGLMHVPENAPPARRPDAGSPNATERTQDPSASKQAQDPATGQAQPESTADTETQAETARSTASGDGSPTSARSGGTAAGKEGPDTAVSHADASTAASSPAGTAAGRPAPGGRPVEDSAAGSTVADEATRGSRSRKSKGRATPVGWVSLHRGDPSNGQTQASVPDASRGAAASLASAAGATKSVDVLTPDRDMSDLSPALRQKVESVIDRMARERGEKVVLSEGYRTPARQAYLYAQGRSRPGPVVTWTKHSLHSKGLAADLRVEGAKGDPSAYEALQRIAGEEGLRTLGMKDPGHVELDVDAGGAGHPRVPSPTAGIRLAGTTGTASVARVAAPAAVASTARVATVARPGASAVRAHSLQNPAASAAPAATVAAKSRRAPRGATLDDEKSTSGGGQRAEPATAAAPKVSGAAMSTPSTPTILSRPAAAAAAVGGTARVERAMELKEALGSASPSRVSLRMDGAGGPVDRLHVALVDSVVSGRVDVDNATLATRLRTDQGALLRSLADKGFDPQALSVRIAAQSGAEAAHAVRDAMVGSLHLDATSGALRSMLSGESANSQGSPHQGSRGTGGWAGSRQRGAFQHRSQEEQRRDRQ